MKSAADPKREAPPADLMAEYHRELDRQLEDLMERAQAYDASELNQAWPTFERELLRHLELEEAEILPGYARQDPGGARAIVAEHAALRDDLFELGLTLDLHLLRAHAVVGFVERLRAHARREEEALYRWAQGNLNAESWRGIERSLEEAREVGLGKDQK